MRYTRLYLQECGADPPANQSPGMARLIQGGYVREIGPGLFAFLPLGLRVLQNIIEVIRHELLALEGEEMLLPVLSPAGLWEQSGRDQLMAEDITYLLERNDRSLALSPSHEESLFAVARQSFSSVSQLPVFLFQFQLKFKDESGKSRGLSRAREFLTADAFSLHESEVGLNNFFPKVHAAFERIFSHFGLQVKVSPGAADYSAGQAAYEFLLPSRRGEHTLVLCPGCGYRANQDVAVGLFRKRAAKLLPLEPIKQKLGRTPEEVRSSTGMPILRVVQCELFLTLHGLALAAFRGDQKPGKDKISRLLADPVIRSATDEEVLDLGLVPHYLSPLNLDPEIKKALSIVVIVDTAVADSTNLTMPANQEGLYYANANFGRDFGADIVGDICRVDESCRCHHCGSKLKTRKVVKLAQLLKLGDSFSRSMEFSLRDERGELSHPHLGSYGIWIARLMSMVAEYRSDQKGMCWPLSLSPFKVMMLVVGKGHTLQQLAEHLYERIREVALWDDRKIPVNQKFKDADRMGIPVRIVVNAASLQNASVMLSHRLLCKPTHVSFDMIIQKLEELEELERAMGPQGEPGLGRQPFGSGGSNKDEAAVTSPPSNGSTDRSMTLGSGKDGNLPAPQTTDSMAAAQNKGSLPAQENKGSMATQQTKDSQAAQQTTDSMAAAQNKGNLPAPQTKDSLPAAQRKGRPHEDAPGAQLPPIDQGKRSKETKDLPDQWSGPGK